MVASWFVPLMVLLVMGCETSPEPLSAKSTFVPTSPLDMRRQKHAAVLLDNHGVLVVGGIDGPAGSLHFADVFDPNVPSGAWRASIHSAAYSNLGVEELARLDVRATRMIDGKILVSGGSVCAAMTANLASNCTPGDPDCKSCDDQRKLRGSVLLFNPEKPWYDAWERRGWTTKVHTRHTVTVLPVDKATPGGVPSGHESRIVYLLGGMGKSLPETAESFLYVRDSQEPIVPNSSVDLGSTSVEALKPMGTDWSGHTATLLPADKLTYQDAAILVVGRIMAQDKCEAFMVYPGHAPNAQWEGPLPLPTDGQLPCDGHSAEVIGAKGSEMIAIVGGEVEPEKPLGQVLLFDPRKYENKQSPWTVLERDIPRSYAATAVMKSGALIISGGFLKKENAVTVGRTEVEKYDPASGAWTRLADMNCPRVFHTMTNLNANDPGPADHFLVVGGSGETCADNSDPGSSTQILYLNDECLENSDCSPGNVCRGAGDSKRCFAK